MTVRRALLAPVVAVAVALALVAGLGPSPAAAATDPVGVWPLVPEPMVERGFDPPTDPWGAGHRGVDLAGGAGQPVRSALPGRVSWVGVLAGRGVVVVDHGPTRTTYEPVDASVGVGDQVAAGDRLGTLSLTGSHCLPRACLHWGWIEGAETYLDPLRLVGSGPIRLLPLWRDDPAGDASADPTMVVERAARPRHEVATGVPRPGERLRSADPEIGRVPMPYGGWRPPIELVLTPSGAPAGTPDAAGPW